MCPWHGRDQLPLSAVTSPMIVANRLDGLLTTGWTVANKSERCPD